jgi:hypothetical protein
MKSFIKIILVATTIASIAVGCTKDDVVDTTANQALTSASTFSLSNRLLAGFVIDSSSVPNLSTSLLPTGYNGFRKLLTYDTIASGNKPKVYTVGQVINISTYVRGDDAAIANILNGINFRFFGVPTIYTGAASSSNWIKSVSNPPQSPVQAAEDSIRGFVPRSIDVLNTVSLPTINAGAVTPFTIFKVNTELSNGISYSTYLVNLAYTIPASLSGKLISVNFSVRTSLSGTTASSFRNDLGNVNWNYAFRVL